MALNIVWEETHGRSTNSVINGVRTIILFSNPYKVCQITKLNSLPNKPCSQSLATLYTLNCIIQPLLNFQFVLSYVSTTISNPLIW